MLFEEVVISFCSPVLAGIKPANLFSVKTKNHPNLEEEVDCVNQVLFQNGLTLYQVSPCKDHVLFFVYRADFLKDCICKQSVERYLRRIGYDMSLQMEEILQVLFAKVACEERFPHEIGLFLGYPLEDIEGFVKHQGKNCKMFGYWKVYSDEKKAKTLFSEYDRCKEKLVSLYKQGTSFNQLCVAS